MRELNVMIPMLYGAAIMYMFLDVHWKAFSKRKKIVSMSLLLLLIGINEVATHVIGQPGYGKLYALLVQLPVFLYFSVISEYRGIRLLFVILSAVSFSAPPLMFVGVLKLLFHVSPPVETIALFLTYLLMAIFVCRFLKEDFNYMMEKGEKKDFFLFCIIPVLHYIYVYVTTKYNFVQIVGVQLFLQRQIPTIIVFMSYVLLLQVFRNTRENQRLQGEKEQMDIQMSAANFRLNELMNSYEQTRQYRHDMRHHVALLQGWATKNDMEQMENYLHMIVSDLDSFTPLRYCENETANLILTSFVMRAEKLDVDITVEASLPEKLSLSDTELCSLLSNSLENAVRAAAAFSEPSQRKVYAQLTEFQDKLLLQIKNPVEGTVCFEDGLPVSSDKTSDTSGHGFGARGIRAIAEKYGGQALFEEKDGIFCVKVMVPQ